MPGVRLRFGERGFMLAYRLFAEGPRLVDDVPVPEPRSGEVLVRIAGAGACHSDLHVIEANAAGKSIFKPPFTLGHENTGWIEAVGPGISGMRIGEPVAVYCCYGCGRCASCLTSAENYCERQGELHGSGLGADGGMANYMLVPAARYLVPLGDLEPHGAAPLCDAGLTPYAAVKRSIALLTPDATAVVIGAGGLGHMAIQILRAITAVRIVVVDLSNAKLQTALALGADNAVQSGENAVKEILELLHGSHPSVVFDFVGSQQTIDIGRKLVGPNGDFNIVGLAGGTMPYRQGKIAWGARVSTPFYGSIAELREVIALAQRGKIRAHVTRFPLDRVEEAYQALHQGTLDGRAVICPNS